MALFKKDGTEMVDADVTAVAGSGVAGPKVYTVTAPVYEDFEFTGKGGTGRRLKFYTGQQITQAQLDQALASSKNA